MKLHTQQIQKHYEGFINTPSLWSKNDVLGLKQFEIEQKPIAINLEIDEKLRLGKYVERLVSFQLKNLNEVEIISENVQIQKDKLTLGEIDCLLEKNKKIIHLEIIYKFYVFDPSVGTSEIECFIGPNRKDSLIEKLKKLTQQQLPLLYTNESKNYLKILNLDVSKIEQQVYFKAQLFLPYSMHNLKLKYLNPACIIGFYIHHKELPLFKNCKFYVPSKKDWLIVPHTNVNWQMYTSFVITTEAYLIRRFSPLIWIKQPSGIIKKAFLVWW